MSRARHYPCLAPVAVAFLSADGRAPSRSGGSASRANRQAMKALDHPVALLQWSRFMHVRADLSGKLARTFDIKKGVLHKASLRRAAGDWLREQGFRAGHAPLKAAAGPLSGRRCRRSARGRYRSGFTPRPGSVGPGVCGKASGLHRFVDEGHRQRLVKPSPAREKNRQLIDENRQLMRKGLGRAGPAGRLRPGGVPGRPLHRVRVVPARGDGARPPRGDAAALKGPGDEGHALFFTIVLT